MEQAILTWAAEFAKNGAMAIALMVVLYGYWRKDAELGTCRLQSNENNVKMAVAVEQAAKAMADTNEITRQLTDAYKLNEKIMEALIKQLEMSDARMIDQIQNLDRRHADRAQEIINAMRGSAEALRQADAHRAAIGRGNARGS